MSLYGLAAILLVFAIAQTILVFWSYRKRLAQTELSDTLSIDDVKRIFSATALEKGLGYLFIAMIAYLIWQIMRLGFDFSILMLAATVYTGVVWAVDRALIKQQRLSILNHVEASIDGFDDKVDRSALEPGLIENSKAFFPILLFVFVLRSFIVEPFQIPSGSMRPTLEIKDFILVNRFAYGIRVPISNEVFIPVGHPEYGDVIVFKPPHEPQKNYIKRVIAVPGDTLQYNYATREIVINGERIDKQFERRVSTDDGNFNLYIEQLFGREHSVYTNQSPALRHRDEWIPAEGVVVPEGKYFVMGDNRDNSLDARYWEGQRRNMRLTIGQDDTYAWGFVDESEILGEAFVIWMHWKGFYPSFSRAGIIE